MPLTTFFFHFTVIRLWADDNRVLLLISEYKSRKHLFENTKSCIKHDVLFAEISNAFKMFGIQITRKQCKGKMASLFNTFRGIYDECKRTGRPPTKWAFYSKMLEMLKDSASQEPPWAFSVGSGGSKYSAKGKIDIEVPRFTRTRPVPKEKDVDNAKNKTIKKTAPKSWNRELMEKNYDQRVALVEEFRLLRQNADINSKQRMEILASIAQSLKLQCQYGNSSKELPHNDLDWDGFDGHHRSNSM